MKKSKILREATEGALQDAIDAELLNDFVLIGPANVVLDSSDNEIWFATMQGDVAV